jgi:hypothetical protein
MGDSRNLDYVYNNNKLIKSRQQKLFTEGNIRKSLDHLNVNTYLSGTQEQKKNYTRLKARFMPFPIIKCKDKAREGAFYIKENSFVDQETSPDPRASPSMGLKRHS